MTTGSVATGTAATGAVPASTVPASTIAASTAAADGAARGDGRPADTDRVADAGVHDGSKQLRDIEELVAKLAIVTQQLAFPARTMPSPSYADAGQSTAHDI
jgi:hypothetical protein